MKNTRAAVSDHYTLPDLAQRFLDALEAAGKDLEQLSVDDLAPVDGFHIRGRAATEELASLVRVGPDDRVLDVGSGVGGTSRYLASRHGCRTEGIDLTEEYCRIAAMLSARVGLADRTRFRQGDALELPFDDASFDVVWTEHVQMNVADKRAFYTELTRVLRPGGQLAFHDIFAGPDGPPPYPVPWASDASISHLHPATELRALLEGVGLEVLQWKDVTAPAIDFFHTTFDRIAKEGQPPLGLHVILGEGAGPKLRNVLAGLESDALRVTMAVLRRPQAG